MRRRKWSASFSVNLCKKAPFCRLSERDLTLSTTNDCVVVKIISHSHSHSHKLSRLANAPSRAGNALVRARRAEELERKRGKATSGNCKRFCFLQRAVYFTYTYITVLIHIHIYIYMRAEESRLSLHGPYYAIANSFKSSSSHFFAEPFPSSSLH